MYCAKYFIGIISFNLHNNSRHCYHLQVGAIAFEPVPLVFSIIHLVLARVYDVFVCIYLVLCEDFVVFIIYLICVCYISCCKKGVPKTSCLKSKNVDPTPM